MLRRPPQSKMWKLGLRVRLRSCDNVTPSDVPAAARDAQPHARVVLDLGATLVARARGCTLRAERLAWVALIRRRSGEHFQAQVASLGLHSLSLHGPHTGGEEGLRTIQR